MYPPRHLLPSCHKHGDGPVPLPATEYLLNIRQLRYFYLSARSGSFSGAARSENVSVQAVSKALIELEDELGSPLFERWGSGAALTPFGESLVRPAHEAIASFDAVSRAAETFLARQDNATTAGLRLALIAPPFAKEHMMCNALSRIATHMSGIEIRLFRSLGPDAFADLKSGAIDAMITIGAFNDTRCSCQSLGKVSVGVFMGKNHPLRRKRLISFADLKPYPVLYNRDIDDFNDTILTVCRRDGLASPIVEVTTDDGVADLLEERNGYVLGVYLKALDIKPLAIMHRIDPADAPSIPVCIVVLKNNGNEKLDRFCHFIRNEFPVVKKMFSS